MKKLILSAFAMSLILAHAPSSAQTEAVDDFLGLESEIMPDLKGPQKFTPEELQEADQSWKVQSSKVQIDLPAPTRGQNYSIIPWSTQTPEDFLSIRNWLADQEIKDRTPDWKIRLRHSYHTEKMGNVLQCIGSCFIYRGINRAKAQYLSQLQEGDELFTGKDSVAWVFLLDGTLVRLAPETSVAFQEINLRKTEIFILTRLNQGHVFVHPRQKEELAFDDNPETDSYSLPLMIREANQQHFERNAYKYNQSIALSWPVTLGDFVVRDQITEVNKLRKINQESIPLSSRHMMVTASTTIISRLASYDLSFIPGGKSFFKKRTNGEEFNFFLRGYKETTANSVNDFSWYAVDGGGREFTKEENIGTALQILELLTKRIRTFELARELWLQRFTFPVVSTMNNQELLARDHGYTLWGDELDKRITFLSEYTRRVETTHLRSLDNLLAKLEANGEKVSKELTLGHYQKSLSHYLLGLKSRHDEKSNRVREMSDLQYYVWILRHGKF